MRSGSRFSSRSSCAPTYYYSAIRPRARSTAWCRNHHVTILPLHRYVDKHWRRDWDAETLFLEPGDGTGLLVQPRPGRAVLMHQDALHRVSTPSMLARRPRYSLVWKLVFIPRPELAGGRTRESICRPEWGAPLAFGTRQRREEELTK